MKRFIPTLLSVIILSSFAFSQQYPDTLWVKVTFYDFHADGSNPEFEPDHRGSPLKRGMVADTLSADRKPVLGNSPYFSYYLHKWFQPWTAGDFTIPVYTDRNGTYDGAVTVDYDTAFINTVIPDSLPFLHQGDGVYTFVRNGRNGTSEFFWIDERGFGEEPAKQGHNFAFTMELHNTFTYTQGLKFNFTGDDDVWAYINGRLAMDLGGIHTSQTGEIDLDEIAAEYGLVEGGRYAFDFFYAERHTSNSTIQVSTNLFTPPANLRLYSKPGAPDVDGNLPIMGTDTIAAGQPYSVYAHVFDSTVWKPEWDSLVTWSVIDPEGNVTILSQSGGVIQILPSMAFGSVTLTATFKKPDNPIAAEASTSVSFYIGPGKPHHITIQTTPDIILHTENSLQTLNIPEDQASATLYAVVRDSLGNFIRFAENAVWQSTVPQVATVTPEQGRVYQALVEKKDAGVTQVSVSESGLPPAVVEISANAIHIGLESAITGDIDGDGFIDRIDMTFDRTVEIPAEMVSLFRVVNGEVSFTIDSIGGGSGKSFRLYIKERTDGELQTDWTPLLSIGPGTDITPVQNFLCTDGIGPIVNKAIYFPGALRSGQNANGTPDTIKVTISELVKWPANPDPDQIFRYYRGTKPISDAFSSISIIDDSTAILVVSSNISVETDRDSLQLASSSGLTDRISNDPLENGRKASIDWGNVSIVYIPSTNPFVPLVTKIPPAVRNYYQPVINRQVAVDNADPDYGTVIGVQVKGKPLAPVSGRADSAYGKVAVYDAVGNLIKSNIWLYKADGNEFGIYWDGRNENGRQVGRGVYLFRVVTRDTDKKAKIGQFKIGVN
ncbi:MAG: fibro-slime domain-containing protein [Fibrobacter sp.]|nr:fibro-slime domain-containing protein [Fibrobacter sp.]